MKVAIDQYIATGQLAPLDRLAALYLVILVVAFVADYAQTWTMQLTGQKLMFDLRMELYRHLQRLDLKYYDRNPVGRLMTRVTSDVDVLNDLFTAGVVTVFGDVFTLAGIMVVMLWMDWRLALVAFCVLPLIVLDHAVVPAERPRIVPRRARPDRADQRLPAGEHHRHVDGAAVPARGAELLRGSTRSTASIATRTSSRSSTTRSSTRRWKR